MPRKPKRKPAAGSKNDDPPCSRRNAKRCAEKKECRLVPLVGPKGRVYRRCRRWNPCLEATTKAACTKPGCSWMSWRNGSGAERCYPTEDATARAPKRKARVTATKPSAAKKQKQKTATVAKKKTKQKPPAGKQRKTAAAPRASAGKTTPRAAPRHGRGIQSPWFTGINDNDDEDSSEDDDYDPDAEGPEEDDDAAWAASGGVDEDDDPVTDGTLHAFHGRVKKKKRGRRGRAAKRRRR